MIIGIGLDIIEVSRFSKKTGDERFLSRLFTDRERDLFESRDNNPQVIAGNFAGKEAVLKAFGTGFASGYEREIEILRDESGRPYVILSGKAKSAYEALGASAVHISLSNIKELACAQVIIEK
jgi:holo-[acyl-carrier protein] synthase